MTQHIYPGPIALIIESWELFKINFFKLIKVMIVPMVVFLIGALILGISGTLFALIFRNNSSALFFLIPLGIIFLIGLIVLGFWSQVAILYRITHLDDSLSIKETYRLSWPLIGGFFVTSMIVNFIVFGGFSVFIIPGIVLCISMAFTLFIAVNEKIYNLDAALKSRHYLIGHRWAYLGRMLLLVLIQFIVYTIFGAFDPKNNSIIIALLEFIFNIASSVFFMIYGYLNYKYLSQIAPTEFDPKVARTKYKIFAFLSIVTVILFTIIFMLIAPILSQNAIENRLKNMPTQNQYLDQQAQLDQLIKTLEITPIETPTE